MNQSAATSIINSSHPGHHTPYTGTSRMAKQLAAIAENRYFQAMITISIILAGILVGIETYAKFAAQYSAKLTIANSLILWIFVSEIFCKMGGHGKHFWRYFKDPWNIFDFIIVAACFLPFSQEYALVLRLIRLMRILKLITALPKLQILVNALLKSLPSMAYVSILLLLLFYIYACAAVFLFSGNDPLLFGDLHSALLTLFRVVTLEDWTDVMYTAMYGCQEYPMAIHQEALCTNSKAQPLIGAFFFVSFILLGTMIALNLFIGIIMKGMDEAHVELEAEMAYRHFQETGNPPPSVEAQLHELQQQLKTSQKMLMLISKQIEQGRS